MKAAESHGFDCMVTSDRNMRHQQNLNERKLAIVVLPSGQWPKVLRCLAAVVKAVDIAEPGSYTEVPPSIAPEPKPAAPDS